MKGWLGGVGKGRAAVPEKMPVGLVHPLQPRRDRWRRGMYAQGASSHEGKESVRQAPKQAGPQSGCALVKQSRRVSTFGRLERSPKNVKGRWDISMKGQGEE